MLDELMADVYTDLNRYPELIRINWDQKPKFQEHIWENI